MRRLSVIVPIYGVERYLRQCLDSIVGQTYRNLEIILVDDGGKDGCPAICDEYAAKDPRVRVVHKRNAGYGAAVNTGLDMATGEYVAIVEPDDWLPSDAYLTLMDAAGSDADVVKGNYASVRDEQVCECGFDLDASVVGELSRERRSKFLCWHPSIWTCVYRTAFLRENGIRMKEVPGAGWVDNPFQVQTVCLAERFVAVDAVVYFYRSTVGGSLVDKGDWRTVYDRVCEMDDWLLQHRDLPLEIFAAVYRRHFHYLWMLTQMAPKVGYVKISRLIRNVVREWLPAAFGVTDYLPRTFLGTYRLYRWVPLLVVLRSNRFGLKR